MIAIGSKRACARARANGSASPAIPPYEASRHNNKCSGATRLLTPLAAVPFRGAVALGFRLRAFQRTLVFDAARLVETRREPPNVPWRGIAVAATSIGLGIGSGLVDGIASYGMLLGAVTAAGIGFRGGPGITWSGMHDHKQ